VVGQELLEDPVAVVEAGAELVGTDPLLESLGCEPPPPLEGEGTEPVGAGAVELELELGLELEPEPEPEPAPEPAPGVDETEGEVDGALEDPEGTVLADGDELPEPEPEFEQESAVNFTFTQPVTSDLLGVV